eukprot:4592200-Prymnesium_polylepis.1
MREYLSFLKGAGINALRIPLAVDHIESNPLVQANMVKMERPLLRPHVKYLDALDRLIALSASFDLLVLLDVHRLKAAVWPDPRGLWFSGPPSAPPGARDAAVHGAWGVLVDRYCGQWNVFGADLFNEPWGASWGGKDGRASWRAAAAEIGNAVLRACPRLLVLVEGVGNSGEQREYFWGENLAEAAANRVSLDRPNKVAYSPHVYGPGRGHVCFHESSRTLAIGATERIRSP